MATKKTKNLSQWKAITDIAALIRMLQTKAAVIIKNVEGEDIQLKTYDFDGFIILSNSEEKIEKINYSDAEIACEYLKIPAPSSIVFNNSYGLYAFNNNEDVLQYISFNKAKREIRILDEFNIIINKETFKDETLWDSDINEKFNSLNSFNNIEAIGRAVLNYKSNFNRMTQEISSLMGLVEKYTRIRIQLGNRLVSDIYTSLGHNEYHKFCEEHGIDKNNGIKITDYVVKLYNQYNEILIEKMKGKTRNQVTPSNFNKIFLDPSPIIPTYQKYVVVSAYISAVTEEEKLRKAAENLVTSTRLWNEYLSGIRGVGWTTAAYILSYLDPYKARHPSSFVCYCGLDTRPNSEGKLVATSKKYPVLKPSFTVDKEGEFKAIESLGCNLIIKSFLCEVMMDCIIKAGKGYYRKMYDEVKARYTNRFANDESITKYRIERMTKRKVASQFLIDLWVNWRKLEGLETHDDYAKAKLGITHNFPGYNPNTPDM